MEIAVAVVAAAIVVAVESTVAAVLVVAGVLVVVATVPSVVGEFVVAATTALPTVVELRHFVNSSQLRSRSFYWVKPTEVLVLVAFHQSWVIHLVGSEC